MNRRVSDPRPVPQPRARHPGLQPPRAGAGGRRHRAAARAAALHHHRLVQPGRVLRDPGRRPEGADQARPARARPRRPRAHRGVRGGEPRSARAGRRAVPAAQPDGAAGARRAGHRVPEARGMERGAAPVDPRLLLPRAAAGADADRPRPGAPVPARVQQEPELRRRARGPRRLRPQLGRGDRAGAARAAARDPAAAGDRRRRGVRLRVPVLDPARAHRTSCSRA